MAVKIEIVTTHGMTEYEGDKSIKTYADNLDKKVSQKHCFLSIKKSYFYFDSSLSEGACCKEDCQLLTKADEFVCSDETECSESAFCDGTQSFCPAPKPKSNANNCRQGTMVSFVRFRDWESYFLFNFVRQ